MAIRKIRKIGDSILTKVAKPVEKIDPKIIDLIDDMIETMKQADGAGLAAPQVGVLRRVAVVDIGEGVIELINPQIIKSEGEVVAAEGCLSIPGKHGDVARPKKVTVVAYNRNSEKFTLEAEDFLARAICHEIDHLDGILYITKAVNITEDL